MQCIARGVQGLPITELELATIVFAGLNFVIYLLWWDKPLNLRCGVRVYKKRITDEPVDDGYVEGTAGFWVALGDALSKASSYDCPWTSSGYVRLGRMAVASPCSRLASRHTFTHFYPFR